jgi:putative Holliday junction resolvase
MRILGMDLGTKTLGLAITDKSNTIASPLKVIHYDGIDFNPVINEIASISRQYDVDTFVLGLPKNMNNSMGFAAERSMNFKKILDAALNVNTILVDERLSTVEAENILINNDMRRNKRKQVIDGVAAMIILDTYLRTVKHE